MNDEKKLKIIMEECNKEHLTDFMDRFFTNWTDMLNFLREDEWNDKTNDYANDAVSYYTEDRFEWAQENSYAVAKYEREAMENSVTINGAIAFCWYETVLDELTEELTQAKEKLIEIEGEKTK